MNATTPEIGTFTLEIKAGVDAVDTDHALVLVALELLASAYRDDDDATASFGPDLPAGYIGFVDFSVEREQ
jgi:hypothetical protein